MVTKIRIFGLIVCFCSSIHLFAGDSLFVKGKSIVSNQLNFNDLYQINAVLKEAHQHLNTPYRSGGKTPEGFDCSGFVRYCFGTSLDKLMPASSKDYDTFGLEVDINSCRPGDIICFKGHQLLSNRIGHVGIITEVSKDDIYFIHSANHGGIRIDRMNSKYYADRMVGIRRVN